MQQTDLLEKSIWYSYLKRVHLINQHFFLCHMAPSLHRAGNCTDLEKPSISMIAHMIRRKASVPYDIIQMEMVAAPTVTVPLFQWVMTIQWIWELPKKRCSRLVFMSWRQLAEHFIAMLKWKNGFSCIA